MLTLLHHLALSALLLNYRRLIITDSSAFVLRRITTLHAKNSHAKVMMTSALANLAHRKLAFKPSPSLRMLHKQEHRRQSRHASCKTFRYLAQSTGSRQGPLPGFDWLFSSEMSGFLCGRFFTTFLTLNSDLPTLRYLIAQIDPLSPAAREYLRHVNL